jgi:hypothetical protein
VRRFLQSIQMAGSAGESIDGVLLDGPDDGTLDWSAVCEMLRRAGDALGDDGLRRAGFGVRRQILAHGGAHEHCR